MYDKRIFDNSRYNTFLKVTGNYESDLNNPQLTHDEIAKMIWYCQELQGGKMVSFYYGDITEWIITHTLVIGQQKTGNNYINTKKVGDQVLNIMVKHTLVLVVLIAIYFGMVTSPPIIF